MLCSVSIMLSRHLFYSSLYLTGTNFNICKYSLHINKKNQIYMCAFVFQTPSAVQKIKELLKDKPDHVSIDRVSLYGVGF